MATKCFGLLSMLCYFYFTALLHYFSSCFHAFLPLFALVTLYALHAWDALLTWHSGLSWGAWLAWQVSCLIIRGKIRPRDKSNPSPRWEIGTISSPLQALSKEILSKNCKIAGWSPGRGVLSIYAKIFVLSNELKVELPPWIYGL